jgi:hypothetical protein
MHDAGLFRIWVFLAGSPLLWLTVTVLAYLGALHVHRLVGGHSLANPVLISVAALVCVLLVTGTSYPTYFDGAKFVHFLIGPATVALAVPLYAQNERLKRMWLPIGVALLVGSATAMAVSGGAPPTDSDTAIAIGKVDDLGASDSSEGVDAPSTRPMATAETMAVTEPTSRAAPMGSHIRFSRSNCEYSGMASATVAGPIRKCTNLAPSK